MKKTLVVAVLGGLLSSVYAVSVDSDKLERQYIRHYDEYYRCYKEILPALNSKEVYNAAASGFEVRDTVVPDDTYLREFSLRDILKEE
ncbi:Uncharacterised protein [Helicobacter cinaedi]|uniref:Uncharacterized protein n=1 Tax=Helicobacter cinaedi TaxID=213 RepID=A0A377JU86_9HELI|nr:hypothetical protein [Helicobacter cinaedi]STP11508.1 Uncharacterised protein [Helicobacter cinaedi]